MTTDKIRVAVYGSLKSGFGLHTTLKNHESKLLGKDRIPYFLMMDLNAYPAIMPSMGMGDAVDVEVYEITEACLASLDRIEGVDSFHYERIPIETRLGQAFIYQYHPEAAASRLFQYNGIRIVEGGNWAKPPQSSLWSLHVTLTSLDPGYRARIEETHHAKRYRAGTNVIPFRQGGIPVLAPPKPVEPPKEAQYDLSINFVEDVANVDVSDSAI